MNINFEDLPKHDVSRRSLKKLEKVMFSQDDFGIKKYGIPLNHAHKYNWLEMLVEELADGIKYIQCELDRREYVISILEDALNSDNPKENIELALLLLTVEGTGK